jgi:hypothetical protein
MNDRNESSLSEAPAAQAPALIGFYSFYDCGHGDVMFQVYKPDGTYGSSHCIDGRETAKNSAALRAMGYRPRAALAKAGT